MKLDIHPVTNESRDYLRMPPRRSVKRIKLRTPEAIARRVKYKQDKLKKVRIRCLFCNKRFTPKRNTKKFCNANCRKKSNINEHRLFREQGIWTQLFKLSAETKKATPQIELMRSLLAKVA